MQQMEAILCSIYLPVVLSLERSCYELGERNIDKQNFPLAHPVTLHELHVGTGLSSKALKSIAGWNDSL